MNVGKRVTVALTIIFLCAAGIVAYIYFAGADKRAIEANLENVRKGIQNSDADLVMAQVSQHYNHDGYSRAILDTALPIFLKRVKVDSLSFSKMEIKIDKDNAKATFRFSSRLTSEFFGVQASTALNGNAEVTLAKENDEWKITGFDATEDSGEKLNLPR